MHSPLSCAKVPGGLGELVNVVHSPPLSFGSGIGRVSDAFYGSFRELSVERPCTLISKGNFDSDEAPEWARLFETSNGPLRNFGGAYSAEWFCEGILDRGMEVVTLRSEEGLLGVVAVFFEWSGLPVGHTFAGVFVDETSFGERYGKSAVIAGEAYRKDYLSSAPPQITAAVIANARMRDIHSIVAAMAVSPIDPYWELIFRLDLPIVIEPPFPHPKHSWITMRRTVISLRKAANCVLTPDRVIFSP